MLRFGYSPDAGWSGPGAARGRADAAPSRDRVARYRRQLAVYGVVVEQLLGRAVEGAMLVRCRPDGPAEQIEIDGWDAALADARSLIAVTA